MIDSDHQIIREVISTLQGVRDRCELPSEQDFLNYVLVSLTCCQTLDLSSRLSRRSYEKH